MTTTAYEEAVVEAKWAEQVHGFQDPEGYVMLGYQAALRDFGIAINEAGAAIDKPNPVSLRLYNIIKDKHRSLIKKALDRAKGATSGI